MGSPTGSVETKQGDTSSLHIPSTPTWFLGALLAADQAASGVKRLSQLIPQSGVSRY
jgi:hypothetical protein